MLVAAAGLLGADVSGKWKADFTSPDGAQRTATFTFKADGTSSTGTVAGSQDETAIQNGTVNGDDLFTVGTAFRKIQL